VDSGQFDANFSNITVTEERKDKYDFATYRTDTLGFEVKAGRDLKITEPKDIAGLKVSVSAGTNQEQILLRWDAKNKAAGLPAAQFQYYPGSTDYYIPLQSGRIDVWVGPYASVSYHAVVSGQTKVVGQISGGGDVPAQIAAMTKKGNGLVKPLADALNHVIGSGKYGEVLTRWSLTGEGVPASEVNPLGLPRK
jgi:polar amino acid transport system substrate-binding protein